MPGVSILLTDPRLKVFESPNLVSFCGGFTEDEYERTGDWLQVDDSIEEKVSANGDAYVIQVTLEEGKPVQVQAWKALLSNYDIFFRVMDDGSVLVSDHMRNALSELPMSDREVSDQALLDHLLFRSLRGRETYCDGFDSVALGERVSIDLEIGAVERATFDKLGDIAEHDTLDVYLAGVEDAMEHAAWPLQMLPHATHLFSGGINSTLLHYYLGKEFPALAGEAWNVDEHEKDYPAMAAHHLKTPLETFYIEEDEFLPRLESAVDLLGQPPSLDQIVIFEKAYSLREEVFIASSGADPIFGVGSLNGVSAQFGRGMCNMPLAGVLTKGAKVLSGLAGPQLSRIANSADLFREPVTSPHGFAGTASIYTDMGIVGRSFGKEAIDRRLEHRLNIALDRFEFSAPESDNLTRQLELGHWVMMTSQDGSAQMRQLAHGMGKVLLCPFNSRCVMDSALRVPAEQRYVHGSEAKYLLKWLLNRRVPGYPVEQEKGSSLFGVEGFFKNGPLKDFWERYGVPDFLDDKEQAAFLKKPTMFHWNVATLAMWRDRVLRNENLTPTPHMKRFDY